MKTPLACRFLAAGLFAALAGCSSKNGPGVAGSGSCASALPGVSFNSDASCPAMCAPANAGFCAGDGIKNSCASAGEPIDDCGVSVAAPASGNGMVPQLTRSSDVKEFAGKGPPDLSCFSPSGYPAPPDTAHSMPVKVTGTAKIFSHGCDSTGLTIEIHKVVRSGGADDGSLGELVGTQVTTAMGCTPSPDTKMSDMAMSCPGGMIVECSYEYDGVPTETELMVKTSGPNWAALYEYGMFIRNADVQSGGYKKDVRALAAGDYTLIPQVTIGKTVRAGDGVLAGEVHDCASTTAPQGVRLSGATVDIDQPKYLLTYFSDNEDNPLPVTSAKVTSTLGLFAAFDVAPGPVNVAAAGVAGGKLNSLGYFRARVFPNSVSTYTFHGLPPFQAPSK